MTYLEIKKEIEEVSNLITECRISIDSLESADYALREQLEGLSKAHEDKIKELETLQRNRYYAEIAKHYDDKIMECIEAKSKLKAVRDKKIEKIESLDYAKKFSSDYDIKNEENVCNDLKEGIKGFYGDEFYNNINGIKRNKKVSDVSSIVPSLRSKSELMSNSVNITGVMNKIAGGIEYKENKSQVAVVGAVSAVALVASVVFYPITILAVTGSMFYNVYKSHFFIECSSVCKAFDQNIDKVKSDLENKIKEEINKDLDKVNEDYESRIKVLNKTIDSVENERDLKIEEEKVNFVPDTREVTELNREERLSIEDRFSKNNTALESEKRKLRELVDKLNKLKESLDSTINSLVDVYMPKELQLGKSLPKDYLINIKNNKPELFSRPNRSCLFIYRDIEKCNQFIHLLFYQTLLRTDPDLFKFDLIDTLSIDSSLSFYSDSKEKSQEPVVKEIAFTEEIGPFLKACDEELRLRKRVVRGFDNLEEYNSFMMSQDCPQETSHFIIQKDPNLDSLITETNKSIITNGASVGYYEFIFINEREFNSNNSGPLTQLLDDRLGLKTFMISDSVNPRSKSLFLEKLEN